MMPCWSVRVWHRWGFALQFALALAVFAAIAALSITPMG